MQLNFYSKAIARNLIQRFYPLPSVSLSPQSKPATQIQLRDPRQRCKLPEGRVAEHLIQTHFWSITSKGNASVACKCSISGRQKLKIETNMVVSENKKILSDIFSVCLCYQNWQSWMTLNGVIVIIFALFYRIW